MPATIILKSPSGVDDYIARLSNAQFARPFNIGSWNRLRVGMRWVVTDNSIVSTGNTTCIIGLCSGTTNLPGDSTCQHAIGMGSVGSWGLPGSGAFDLGVTSFVSKIGTTLTTGLGTSSFTSHGVGRSDVAAQRSCWFVDFTKGSPNWTLKAFHRNDSVAVIDVSQQSFLDQMEIDVPSLLAHTVTADYTFAVDEGTNGTLNAMFFWWSRSVPYAEISDIALTRFA